MNPKAMHLLNTSTLMPQVLELRKSFLAGDRPQTAGVVLDRWDNAGRSCYRNVLLGGRVVATSRMTVFDPRFHQDATNDLINSWTGLVLPEGPRLILSRIAVELQFRRKGLNRMLILRACFDAMQHRKPIYCLVRKELTAQLETFEKIGFTPRAEGICQDIPGKELPVYLLELPITKCEIVHELLNQSQRQLNALFVE